MRLYICAALAVLAAAGCESTQNKSDRLAGEAKSNLADAKGVVVKKQNPQVKILSTATLKDRNGEAMVVQMRNTGRRVLARMPIAVELKNRSGKAVYRNDTPGLETALVQVPLLAPGKELWWVNDQVVSTGRVARAKALVGASKAAGRATPRIALSSVRLESDPVSGVAATGRARNNSDIEQKRLPIFCVARQGDRVVAAGRAIIDKLKPGKSKRFTIFFIGDPRKGKLTLGVAPTVLETKKEI